MGCKRRPPARITFAGREILGQSTWTQAPVLLQALGMLAGFDLRAIRATLDERLLGYEVTTFVLIQLESQNLVAIEAFEAAIAAIPRFVQCSRISGDADFMLKCVAPSVDDMRQQLLQFVYGFC